MTLYSPTGSEYKKLQHTVKEELEMYNALKVQLENRRELKALGINNIFPSLRSSYKDNELKVKHISRTLEKVLDDTQRHIINEIYLSRSKPKSSTLYKELGIKKDDYYKKKKSAIILIAYALGII